MLVLSIIFIFIYLILLIWFSNTLFYYKRNNVEKLTIDPPNVSVIISARNEENNLPQLLDILMSQNYPLDKYEIIIANDRSVDKTEKIIRFYKNKFHNIKLINIKKTPLGWSSKKWALTKAIELSSSDIILQTDADCLPSNNWISCMVDCFSNPNVGFVCGASPLIHSDLILNKIFQMESMIQEAVNAGAITNNLILSCTGRNIAFKKTHFNNINGYINHEHILSGDDDLLLQKFALESNCLIQYEMHPDSLVKSYAPSRFLDFLNQRLRFASKGLLYFNIKTTIEFKFIIILLFLTNIFFILNLFSFINTMNLFFILPIITKMSADFILSYVFMFRMRLNWSLIAYLILTLLHPFYIVIIGLLGPFYKVNWKR